MKTRALIVLPIVALLGACNTTGPGPVPPSPISVLPDSIKSAVLATCGVVLTAQSLSQLLPLFNGTTAQVASFAASVCSTLTATAQGRGGKQMVSGNFMGRRIVGVKVR